jgi:hypothetical protein
MVLEWNAFAIAAISNPQITAVPIEGQPHPALGTPRPGLAQGPPLSPIHVAMVDAAMYDAVIAIEGGYEPYLDGLDAPAGASPTAATAAAAYRVLLGIVEQSPAPAAAKANLLVSLDDLYASSLTAVGSGDATDKGIEVGEDAAAALLADRARLGGDGRFGSTVWQPSTDVGKWRHVPNNNANAFAWIADARSFTLVSNAQFRTQGPPLLTSDEYARDFNEVKALGGQAGQAGNTRSEEQSRLATFVTGNPVPYMNAGLRSIAEARGLSLVDQARLIAKSNIASADALIACWDDKRHWSAWRPTTAIREAADDGNPDTAPQAGWLANFPVPGYPDQPSGYNCYTGAFWHAARLTLGTDRVSFTLTSPALPAFPRSYTRLTGVIDDTIDGRIYTGFHFRFADVDGAWLGKKTAQWVDKNFFAPTN